jgi:hypothetical protein
MIRKWKRNLQTGVHTDSDGKRGGMRREGEKTGRERERKRKRGRKKRERERETREKKK